MCENIHAKNILLYLLINCIVNKYKNNNKTYKNNNTNNNKYIKQHIK